MVDRTLSMDTTAYINKVKDLALVLLISVISPSRLHLLRKTCGENVLLHTFSYSQPFNVMLIFNSKYNCLVTSFLDCC